MFGRVWKELTAPEPPLAAAGERSSLLHSPPAARLSAGPALAGLVAVVLGLVFAIENVYSTRAKTAELIAQLSEVDQVPDGSEQRLLSSLLIDTSDKVR